MVGVGQEFFITAKIEPFDSSHSIIWVRVNAEESNVLSCSTDGRIIAKEAGYCTIAAVLIDRTTNEQITDPITELPIHTMVRITVTD